MKGNYKNTRRHINMQLIDIKIRGNDEREINSNNKHYKNKSTAQFIKNYNSEKKERRLST